MTEFTTTKKTGVLSMSKVIQVLEQMGSDGNCQSEQAIDQLLATTEVNAEQAEAIINKDVTSLERQLDVCPDIVCIILPADDEEGEGEDDSTEETSNNVIGF